MTFGWDEKKRNANRAEHGLDFEAVFSFDWENALLADRTRGCEGEQRYAALGIWNEQLHTIVFTKRGSKIRVISLRRCNRKEENAYDSAQTKEDKG